MGGVAASLIPSGDAKSCQRVRVRLYLGVMSLEFLAKGFLIGHSGGGATGAGGHSGGTPAYWPNGGGPGSSPVSAPRGRYALCLYRRLVFHLCGPLARRASDLGALARRLGTLRIGHQADANPPT